MTKTVFAPNKGSKDFLSQYKKKMKVLQLKDIYGKTMLK